MHKNLHPGLIGMEIPGEPPTMQPQTKQNHYFVGGSPDPFIG